jgi:phage nucleotide-binding protein
MLPPRGTAQKPSNVAQKFILQFGKPNTSEGRRILIYGAGGVGKTTLALGMDGKTAFVDLDNSLGKLDGQFVNIDKIDILQGVNSWESLLGMLDADGWNGYDNIVIDTMTMAEQLAVEYTLATVPNGNSKAKSVEDYGYGKGYGFVFESFLKLLPILEKHTKAGRNIIMICHDCQRTVANPAGGDYLRFEPRLQDPASGKGSIRLRLREWCDEVLFVAFDISVDEKARKAKGAGLRSVYTSDQTWCMAKSRATTETLSLDDPSEFWKSTNFIRNNKNN